jgi:hypothetical protein
MTHHLTDNDASRGVVHAGPFPYPIIADTDRDLATQLGMLDPEEKDAKGAPMTCRAVFIISPDKKLKLSILCVPRVPRRPLFRLGSARASPTHFPTGPEPPLSTLAHFHC